MTDNLTVNAPSSVLSSSVLWLRLLFAACLLFGSEILLWTNPTGRTVVDWLLLVPGYVALAALLLDLMQRYRIRDLFCVMLLSGVYGLCASLLLNPQTALVDLSYTLVTRVMGGHTLLGLEMIGLFLALTGGRRRVRYLLLAGSGVVGLAWGIWVRWFPVLDTRPFAAASLETMLAYGVGGLLAIGFLLRVASRNTAGDVRLLRRGWSITLLVLLALFVVHLLQGAIDGGSLIFITLLLILCLTILWFRKPEQGGSLLDAHIPVRPMALLWIVIAALFFFGMALLAYQLPFIEAANLNQYTFVVLGFTAYGMGWLPFISLVLGVRAAGRLTRERRL